MWSLKNIKNKKNQIKPAGFLIARNKIYLSLNNGRIIKTDVSTGIEENIYIATEEKSYDLNNELLKTKIFNFVKIDNYYIMDRLDVVNVQKNHSTLLTVNEISLNNNFEDSKFSQRSLKIIPK